MDFFRRSWAQIRVQLDKLPPSTKLLVGSLLVILLLVGFLVLQYAARPELVALMQVPPDRLPAVQARLESAAIKVQSRGAQLMVPAEQRDEAYAILAQDDLLAGDGAAAIDQMIKSQTPWQPKGQTDRAYLNAKRQVLGQ